MIVNKTKKRLKAIKLKYVFFATKCNCCGKEYKFEKMWRFFRTGFVNDEWVEWHYCKNCMHSAEDVLNEIDTDEYPFGIAGIDNNHFFKKDYTRMNLAVHKRYEKSYN